MNQPLNIITFANALGLIVVIFHPIIYFLIRRWPRFFEYFVRLATFGVVLNVEAFELSFKNMLIGTILKTVLFWLFGFFLALFYNLLLM